ncbi:GGDEF domain-containing protein [Halanaerobium hydrogeniformans]|uniref:Diguanylate cyclase n=1 Tax=Halanaerobium hydrogeniformans TaxID=656519 RepID=E4RNZ6_HALHG|nr:GGDEF domain-containing protein [Halanaerobium hydrogeniformans]ADQ13686.1 diguanylate cyclase [Halanaerobium hydrogeniformans]
MFDDLYSKCPYPLDLFLEKISSYLLVNFDEDLYIRGCNEKFLKTVNMDKQEIKNKKMDDIFRASSLKTLDFDSKRSYQKVNLCFEEDVIIDRLYNQYNSYFFILADGYYLIAKENAPDQGEIINKISRLNNELANKTRELSRKNVKLEKANQKIEELLKTDKLTGLSNRRHFMEYFEKMIANAKRHSLSLSLVMCDLDHFKKINDNYGHGAGDRVLEEVGELLLNETRQGDLASRIGGEEFTIILNGTSLKEGKNYAERIRKKVSNLEFAEINKKVTISMGITEIQAEDNAESFLKRADRALYKAKNNGRNRVETL